MKTTTLIPVPFLLAVVIGGSDALVAQRGRGPSEAIQTRSGSYFVTVDLPAPIGTPGGKIPPKIVLETTELVVESLEDEQLTFLYLYDSEQNEKKHAQFEQTIFGHDEIKTALRLFRCGRADIADNQPAREQFGDDTPLFIAFDKRGKRAGEVSMRDYKAKATPITKLLERAARKHAKVSLTKFVSKYRKFLRDYQNYEGSKRALDQKRERLTRKNPVPRDKLAALDKEETDLEKGREKLLEGEQKLLVQAKVPSRDSSAVRIGDRERRGR